MENAVGVAVSLENITKPYSNGFRALQGVNLRAEPGEWLVLVGPSGCGKTTTLRVIAGLEEPSSGTLRLGGQIANRSDGLGNPSYICVPPWQRNVAMVFQRPALAPTHTVRQNLSFGLRTADEAEVQAIAELLGLTQELQRFPHQLSGGQQQRVALGRALARKAPICLLDEPLGHLDARLRDGLRRELQLWQQRRPATVLSVTHDPREAWALGQRVAVMDQGQVLQVGSPAEVHERPCNRFVAAFFAQGPMNFFEAQLRNEGNSLQWRASDWPEPIPLQYSRSRGDFGSIATAGAATLGIRAEHVAVGGMGGDPMRVTLVEPTPRGAWVTGEIHGRTLTGWTEQPVRVGQKVGITMDWTKLFEFERVTGKTLHAPTG